MMAQMLAIHHPERVRSIGLLSTIPGRTAATCSTARATSSASPRSASRVSRPSPGRRPPSPPPAAPLRPQVEWHTQKAGEAYDRGYAPEGFARQWAALRRAPERLEQLRSVTVPALIFHGRDDELLHWRAAVDMADALRHAELQVHPEVGHLIPHELWPELVSALARTAQRGEEARGR
ncbi:alpha/beta hydrolase [Microbacterium sp. NIBRBAC000506063]|uniref:alpha/beta hydrolase n=1 Tax=Microbacterium sp. NIBRBAC000506063 TaxID=2734618 RepID=UPI001BB7A051|nr:alpha/beta hydrolase [Microbacterium sp. NIBRBAC000506063]QTV80071.1 alpha/beta hydrolase [Microbacterium sp. NIBRBAC000506063]